MSDLITLEESVNYVRANFNELYPKDESRNRTIGNLPDRLHTDLIEYAEEQGLKMYEVIAGLWDFVEQYEADNEKALKQQRSKARR